jgi:hydrogenase nickel incorporation protein HypA/HybF
MHETAIVRDVVRHMVDLAHTSGARRIAGAKIWLGALSHFSAEHWREHFALEARNTLAAGADLKIEVSDDPKHPHAQQVRLESVELED